MLRKTSRLGAQEVTALYTCGRRISSRHFSLVYDDTTKRTAIAVVAGKSAMIGSVERNRIRRRVYTLLRKNILPKMKTTAHIAIGVQKVTFSLSMEELDRELTALFSRTRLM